MPPIDSSAGQPIIGIQSYCPDPHMQSRLTLIELTRMAELVRTEAGGECELSRVAVAWAIRNRGMAGAAAIPRDGTEASGAGRDGPAFWRALAAVCLVWSGEREDPTHGATRFHRHDELPGWARGREPVALIGSRFYY
jgi:spore germination cell wall hydrolase CwlJ-like protein